MTLLGHMTKFGLTAESTARWHEIHLTAQQTDTFGLAPLGTGIVISRAGCALQSVAGRAAS